MYEYADVQSEPADVALPIDRVGVKNLTLPIVVRDRELGRQATVASVEFCADLPAEFKGTHMSRFVEALQAWPGELDYQGVKTLLHDVLARLNARKAFVVFRFPYFLRKLSPATNSLSPLSYNCAMTGELESGDQAKPSFQLDVDVPVMTVCPCSKALCTQGGAHSQRAMVHIRAHFQRFVWLEDLIAVAEAAGSSPVYTLLKREDEKFVTEAAFNNPAFVEDVVRHAAQALNNHPHISWFRVEVESEESIHNHSAFAAIEKSKISRGP